MQILPKVNHLISVGHVYQLLIQVNNINLYVSGLFEVSGVSKADLKWGRGSLYDNKASDLETFHRTPRYL